MAWTKEKDEFLKANYKNMTYAKLAEKLDATKGAVKGRIIKFGLAKRKGAELETTSKFNPNPITHTTIFSVCLWHSEGMSVKEIADMFCRPEKEIEKIIADAKADGQYAKYAHKSKSINLAVPNNEHYENGFAREKNKKVAY